MAVHTGREDEPPMHEQVAHVMSADPSQYPLDALPECLRHAVTEVCMHLKAPVPMVASAALASLSLACQGQNKVRIPSGTTGSVGLYFLTVAESGERKTSVEKLFTQGITDFESRHMASVERKTLEYEGQLQTWKLTKQILQKQLAKSCAIGTPDEEIAKRLEALASQCPSRPRRPQLIYNDTTPEALLRGLQQNLPSAALFSSEGSSILNGAAARNMPALNALWDAAPMIRVDRVKSDSFSLTNARLTMSIMIQPDLLRQFLARKDGQARSSGLLARMLVAYPPSTQGTRFLNHSTSTYYLPMLRNFHLRITQLLEAYYPPDGKVQSSPCVLDFSPGAADTWRNLYNTVESEVAANKYLSDIRDHAAKIAENLARIAALFHLVDHRDTQIWKDSVDRAAKISNWYLLEFKRLFGENSEMSIEHENAVKLENWLQEFFNKNNQQTYIPKSFIYTNGPNPLRNKRSLENALAILVRAGKIHLAFYGTKHMVVLLYPHFQAKYFQNFNNPIEPSLMLPAQIRYR